MSLISRCPVCATAYRVRRSQLAAKGGKVRCGKCGAVFDGVAALLDERSEPLAVEPSPQLGLFDPHRRPSRRAAPAPAAEPEPLPTFLQEETPRRSLPLLWGMLALLAAASLCIQAIYHYRTELAALVPVARPYLYAACRTFGCEVPLPRRASLMSIESSDLQHDGRRERLIVLTAVIRNRAAFAQAYPSLELTLTDEADRPVLRRVLSPTDYLRGTEPPGKAERGIAGGAEAQLRVHLDPDGVAATGYRLYLFYP